MRTYLAKILKCVVKLREKRGSRAKTIIKNRFVGIFNAFRDFSDHFEKEIHINWFSDFLQ